jgi:hypothetical protein
MEAGDHGAPELEGVRGQLGWEWTGIAPPAAGFRSGGATALDLMRLGGRISFGERKRTAGTDEYRNEKNMDENKSKQCSRVSDSTS